METDRSLFRHSTRITVRNYEIDWQGIVHNAVYLCYFEIGRISYLENIGIVMDRDSIQKEFRVVVVRNEINYRSPARYREDLQVLTRIARIGNTSFLFEGILEEIASQRRVAENASVHVWLDEKGIRPVRVSDTFRGLVRAFEGANVENHPLQSP
jgi:acyl-CoA thioester hydrolase